MLNQLIIQRLSAYWNNTCDNTDKTAGLLTRGLSQLNLNRFKPDQSASCYLLAALADTSRKPFLGALFHMHMWDGHTKHRLACRVSAVQLCAGWGVFFKEQGEMFWKTSGGVRRLHGRWEWLARLRAIMNVSSLSDCRVFRGLFSHRGPNRRSLFTFDCIFFWRLRRFIFQWDFKSQRLPSYQRASSRVGRAAMMVKLVEAIFFTVLIQKGEEGEGEEGEWLVSDIGFYSLHCSFPPDWKVRSLVVTPSSWAESITIHPFCLLMKPLSIWHHRETNAE